MLDYTEYYQYTTLAGDTWDAIALDFYKDEHYSTLLMSANSEHIKTIIFQAGVILKIPIIEDTAPDTLPPWKKG